MGIFSCQFTLRVFIIWQIYIYVSLQRFQCFYTLVSAAIINSRKIHSLFLCNFQCGNNLWNIMCSCHQIYIGCSFLLKFQKYLCQSVYCDLKTTVTNGNITILTKAAAQITSCKKDCPGTSSARNTRLFPHMQSSPCHAHSLIHTAISCFSCCPVRMTLSWTQAAIF